MLKFIGTFSVLLSKVKFSLGEYQDIIDLSNYARDIPIIVDHEIDKLQPQCQVSQSTNWACKCSIYCRSHLMQFFSFCMLGWSLIQPEQRHVGSHGVRLNFS